MQNVTIYGLADPRDAHVKYVGQTYSTWVREQQHITTALARAGRRSAKDDWIVELAKVDLKPVLLVLETCHRRKANETEAKWILEMGKKHPLLNNAIRPMRNRCANVVVHVLVGEGDRDVMHHAAFAKGQSMSAWMRQACLDAAAKQGAKDGD